MITRKLDAFMDSFYQICSKALLLTGARQVGKTVASGHSASESASFSCNVAIISLLSPGIISLFPSTTISLFPQIQQLSEKTTLNPLLFFHCLGLCPIRL